MHCANLDGPVKGATQPSPQRIAQQLQQTTETKEEENLRIIKTVLDAGILILEGRLPEPTSKRGYVEGPHCVLYPESRDHQCDLNRYMVRTLPLFYPLYITYSDTIIQCLRLPKYTQLSQLSWKYAGAYVLLWMMVL